MSGTKMASSIIDFLIAIGKLKHIRRTGWVRMGIRDPESVASHIQRTATMTLFLQGHSAGVDRDRCIKMALVHDLAECIIGDLTPHCGVSKDEKRRREKEAMENLSALAGETVGSEIFSLWKEYDSQSTPEAKTVKELDVFDMLLQAYEYEEQEKRPMELQEFFQSSSDKITSPEILEWMKELEKRRNH